MKKLVIFGLGDFARIAYYYFANFSEYNVVGFTVGHDFIKDDKFLRLPVVAFENIIELYPPKEHEMFIAVGYKNLNKIRKKFYLKAKEKGYHLANFISPKATILTKDIGDNVFIFEDNTIQPFVHIGNDVILWSGNHIGHDVVINDHCFISSHVVLSGGVVVNEYSFLGVNSTVRDKVKIGRECVIGAGAIILKNIKDGSVYSAQPAECSKVPSFRLKW